MTQLAHTLQTPIGQAITAGDVDSVNRLVSKGTGILYKDRVRKKGICITGLNGKGVYLFLYLQAVRTLWLSPLSMIYFEIAKFTYKYGDGLITREINQSLKLNKTVSKLCLVLTLVLHVL